MGTVKKGTQAATKAIPKKGTQKQKSAPELRLQTVPIAKINPAKYNPRKDLKPGDPEYEKLKKSIERWSLVEPLVWNERSGNLVGGHQRLKILIEQGYTQVQVSVVNLGASDEKALNVALNKISGGWDEPKLAELLQELVDDDFPVTLTGFDEKELEKLLDVVGSADPGGDSYQEQYGVIVICEDEAHQAQIYEALHAEGYNCKVVVT